MQSANYKQSNASEQAIAVSLMLANECEQANASERMLASDGKQASQQTKLRGAPLRSLSKEAHASFK